MSGCGWMSDWMMTYANNNYYLFALCIVPSLYYFFVFIFVVSSFLPFFYLATKFLCFRHPFSPIEVIDFVKIKISF